MANKAKAARDIYVQARKTDLDNDSADLKNEKNRLANAAIAGTVDGVAISSAEKTLLTHYGLKVMKASQGALDTTTLRDLLETGKCYVINMKNDKGGHALALYLSHGRLGWKTLRRCYLFDPNFGEFRQGVALISTLLGELISSQYTAGFGKFTMWEVAKHP